MPLNPVFQILGIVFLFALVNRGLILLVLLLSTYCSHVIVGLTQAYETWVLTMVLIRIMFQSSKRVTVERKSIARHARSL